MAFSCSLDDTFKINCATYETLDAVKTFLRSQTSNLFFDQISPP